MVMMVMQRQSSVFAVFQSRQVEREGPDAACLVGGAKVPRSLSLHFSLSHSCEYSQSAGQTSQQNETLGSRVQLLLLSWSGIRFSWRTSPAQYMHAVDCSVETPQVHICNVPYLGSYDMHRYVSRSARSHVISRAVICSLVLYLQSLDHGQG